MDTTLTDAQQTLAQIWEDPYVRESACRVGQLAALYQGPPWPVPQCTRATAPGAYPWLIKLTPWLRMGVTVQKHPLLVPLAGAVALGLPILVGYWLGRRSAARSY